MEVRPGYKQTELGVIPEHWYIKRLGELAQLYQPVTISAKEFQEDGFPVYGANGVVGFYHSANHHTWQVTVTCRGSTCGTVNRTVGECWITGNAMVLNCDHNPTISKEFLYYAVLNQDLSGCSTGTGQPQIVRTPLAAFKVPLPPDINEQRAIAAALSDVGALLAGLDRLIAKKRDLKQAVMQQLLTGQTRLPGFHGAWNNVTFADLVRHHSGNSTLIKGKLSLADAVGLFPAFSASGQDVWHPRYEHEGDAIVVSAVGSRCGKAFQATGKWSAIANTHVVWPNTAKVDIRFLARFLDDENFWQKSGTGQPFVLFKKTFAQRLSLPPREEQEAIAAALDEMDAELTALEARRDKTRALKQGMMQELLTGRTRLV